MSRQTNPTSRLRPEDWSGVILLGLLFLLFALLEPRFTRSENLLNVLRQASPLMLAALGQAVVVIAGSIDLSQGSAAALAGMLAIMAAKGLGSGVAGWVMVLLIGGALGAINGLLVSQFRVPAFIATVGMLTYAHGMAYYLGGGLPIEFPPDGYSWLGQGYIGPVPVPVLLALAVFASTYLLLNRTALGRYLYATGGNPTAAALSGVNARLVRFLSFVIGGMLTGMATLVLTGRVNSGPPNLSPNLPFEAIAAIAIGGISMAGGEGSLWRVFVGVGVVSILSNGLNLLGVSTYLQMMIIGGVTIGAVVLDNTQREGILSRLGLGRPAEGAPRREQA